MSDGGVGGGGHIDRAIELNDADRPEHAHVRDARQLACRREALTQPALDRGDPTAPVPRAGPADGSGAVVRVGSTLEQIERGERDGAGERVGHERRPVHQPAPLPCADDVGHVPRAEGRGERHVAAGERLAHAHDIGSDAGVLACEQRARASEAGRDLVEHQQQFMLVAELAHQPHAGGRVKAHAAGSLHDRLDDDRRQLVCVA